MLEKAVTIGYIINTQIVVRRDHVFANFIKYPLSPQNSNMNLLPFIRRVLLTTPTPYLLKIKFFKNKSRYSSHRMARNFCRTRYLQFLFSPQKLVYLYI